MFMSKGERTRQTILETAVALASERGFESLTIGALAERVGMSKSGLFAHFGSREELQVAAIEAAAARYTELVFVPAMKAPRGLPRLHALFENWLNWAERGGWQGGCPLQSAVVEFDDQPGPVRDAVIAHYRGLEQELARAVRMAQEQGHIRADVDVEQFVFEMLALVFATHYRSRLMGHPDADQRARVSFNAMLQRSVTDPSVLK